MPNGENSYWLDGLSTGHKYCTFVGSELLEYIRGTFGMGLSRSGAHEMDFWNEYTQKFIEMMFG